MLKLIGALLIVVLAWGLTVVAVPTQITPYIAKRYAACEKLDAPSQAECSERFSRLGQTGDLFGAATSLFSALGLFAVAFSVWSDSRAARTSKKPLVVCILDEQAITLAVPDFEHKSVRMAIEAIVKNLGEPALNIRLHVQATSRGRKIRFKDAHVELPLATAGSEKIDLKFVLQHDDFNAVASSIVVAGEKVELEVKITYSNLEQVFWHTKVVYCLELDAHGKSLMNALLGNDREQFDNHWADGRAIVSIDTAVKLDSWEHKRAAIL